MNRERRLRPREFAMYHSLGNDYLAIDLPSFGQRLTRANIQKLCDRHTGVGCDGILTRVPSRRADFGLRIFNPDGSEAEQSGNGVRIFSRFLHDFGYTRRDAFSVETPAGVVRVKLFLRGNVVLKVKVEMGVASFQSTDVGATGAAREMVCEALELGTHKLEVTCVSIGNPHCVIFVDELRDGDLREIGPRVENHPRFPRRINVQFARLRTRSKVDALIWERGAGATLASGSSSCAVAAAARRLDLVDDKVQVFMPGGHLSVHVYADYRIDLVGSCTPICRGRLLG